MRPDMCQINAILSPEVHKSTGYYLNHFQTHFPCSQVIMSVYRGPTTYLQRNYFQFEEKLPYDQEADCKQRKDIYTYFPENCWKSIQHSNNIFTNQLLGITMVTSRYWNN